MEPMAGHLIVPVSRADVVPLEWAWGNANVLAPPCPPHSLWGQALTGGAGSQTPAQKYINL